MDLRKSGTKVPENRGFFPKVTTTEAQREFVYEVLIPELRKSGAIEGEGFSDLVRWAVNAASTSVGLKPVEMKALKPGRKRKKAV